MIGLNLEVSMKVYQVQDMTCASCARVISIALETFDPKATVMIDLKKSTVTFDSEKSSQELAGFLENLGFPAKKVAA